MRMMMMWMILCGGFPKLLNTHSLGWLNSGQNMYLSPPPNTYTPRKTLITPILGLSLPILALVLIAHNKLKNSDKDSLTRHIYIHIYPIILSPIRGQSIKGLYPLKLSKPWVPPF
jgi:hypothetical protein